MGLMGTAGTLSIYFVLPKLMGEVFDHAKIAAGGRGCGLQEPHRRSP